MQMQPLKPVSDVVSYRLTSHCLLISTNGTRDFIYADIMRGFRTAATFNDCYSRMSKGPHPVLYTRSPMHPHPSLLHPHPNTFTHSLIHPRSNTTSHLHPHPNTHTSSLLHPHLNIHTTSLPHPHPNTFSSTPTPRNIL